MLIELYLNTLESLSSSSNNPEKLKVIEMEVQQAINFTQGKIMPKL